MIVVAFDYRSSRRLGETETTILEGTNKILCTPRPRGEEQETEPNYLLVLKGLMWRHGLVGAHHRDGGIGRSPLV